METINFLPDFINKINTIREDEFKKFNFQYEDIILEKKVLNEKGYQSDILVNTRDTVYKKDLMNWYNPFNIILNNFRLNIKLIDVITDFFKLN